MILLKAFRSASTRGRHLRTDAQRLGDVRDAVAAALSSIAAEIAGLNGRLDRLGGRAGDLLSTEDGSNFEREDDDEVELRDAEHQLLAGSRRLAELETSKLLFIGLQQAIEGHDQRASAAPVADPLARRRPVSTRRQDASWACALSAHPTEDPP